MDYLGIPSLPAMFFQQAEHLKKKPFLWAKRDGQWRARDWRTAARQVSQAARGLRLLGLEPGQRVALVSENRPEWAIADLAIMAAGGITVPAYTTNTTADHAYILNHSGAAGVIVSTRALAKRVIPAAIDAADCKFVVTVEPLLAHQAHNIEVQPWEGMLAAGAEEPDNVADWVAPQKREDTACFIYTSGTGGRPKGVMQSHGSILCNAMGAYELLKSFHLSEDECFLSFLPLSHAYEHTVGQYFPISLGAEIYYAEGVDLLLGNLAEARPTIMTAVPRLFEAIRQRILRGLAKESATKQKMFELALDLGRKRYEGTPLGTKERFMDFAAERLVRAKVRQRFGGRLKALVAGGAALNYDVGLFFNSLGLTLCQGYGQTEAAPVISCNPPQAVKLHTVGPPLKGVTVRIAEDGEILVRGELLMNGYWRDDAATAKTIVDGWLHTGDIGAFDADNYLQITDRKKDLIVLSGGDNVSPARVEGMLTLEPEIGQAMVIGDKRPHVVALIVPDPEFLMDWCKETGKSNNLAVLSQDKDLIALVSDAVERVNRELSSIERVRRFLLSPEAFTVENEMMTPTMKIRRHIIKATHGEALDGLYVKKG